MSKNYKYSREIPVIFDTDILVVGGSQSGVAAAVSAKRASPELKVTLIEQYGYLGGQSVGTMVVHYEYREYINNAGQRIVKGIGHEMIERVVAKGHTDPLYQDYLDGKAPPFTDLPDNRVFGDIPLDLEDLKLTLQEMCEEAGVEIKYFMKLVDIIPEDENKGKEGFIKPKSAIVAYNNGLGLINSKIMIDCSANNDVAWYLGKEKYVTIPDHQRMPMQTYAWFGGVDLETFINSVFDNKDEWGMRNPDDREQMLSYMRQGKTVQMKGGACYFDIADDKYGDVTEDYYETGANPGFYLWLKTIKITKVECAGKRKYIGDFAMEGPVFMQNQTHYETINKAMISQLNGVHIMKKIHSVMPGWENCFVLRTSQRMGFRQTRILKGMYKLTRDDIKSHRKFDDVIGRNPGHDIGRGHPEEEYGYDIPFRMLVPEKIDGLLVGARSVSCDTSEDTLTALNAHRGICACIIVSQACGVAAALCLKENVEPRNLNILKLQEVLHSQEVILDAPPEGPQGFYRSD